MSGVPVRNLRRQAVFLALVLCVGLGGFLGRSPVEVRAATPDLTLVTAARYDAKPSQSKVAITVDITATNHLHDTTTTRYYFDHAFLAVLPGTSGFKIASTSSSSSSPTVRVSARRTTYTLLRINFGMQLNGGKTATFRLRFNLADPGGSPTRSVRVGTTLVTFPLWAFASDATPGSSVTLTFPAGYAVEFDAGSMAGPTIAADGTQTWLSGSLSAPLSFYAYVVGAKPGAYAETKIEAKVGGTPAALTIRAWPDDPAWAKRVGGLFQRGLPVLDNAIGLPWPWAGPLVVQEAVSRTSGGYAGLFDPSAGRVEVAYYAQPFVILHEAAHAWFNGKLLADRWANEAFASYYALVAAKTLKVKATGETLTGKLRASRIPLNSWGAVGSEPPATENYAYAASLQLAGLIAQRAGPNGLRATWAAAAVHEGAYQPPGGVIETGDGAPDWRGLLDLLEETTGKSFDDLWRTWVVDDSEAAVLSTRTSARSDYSALLTQAGDWRLPRPIRDALRAWQFEVASQQMGKAAAVLDQRAELQREAAASGLALPTTLRADFESQDGLDTASAEAAAELAAIEALDSAAAMRPRDPSVFQLVGLIGAAPAADLARADAAFADGHLQDAVRDAGSARSTWLAAAEIGRSRLVSLALLGLALVVVVVLVLASMRSSRRPMAHRSRRGRIGPAWGPPYGTLADHPTTPSTTPEASSEEKIES